MFPVLIPIYGPINVYSYGVMLALGFLTALYVLSRLMKAEGRAYADAPFAEWGQDKLSALALWAFIGILAGARLFYVFQEDPLSYLLNPVRLIAFWEGGLVFYGGFFGAALSLFLFARRERVPFIRLVDCLAPAVSVGHSIGRVGCFLAGCCYGRYCEQPWAVTFTHPRSLAPHGIPLHPTQIYEACYNLAAFGVLLLIFRRRSRPGQVALAYLVLYSIGRFIIEMYRGDDNERKFVRLWGLLPAELISTSQFISILLLLVALVGIGLLLLPRRFIGRG